MIWRDLFWPLEVRLLDVTRNELQNRIQRFEKPLFARFQQNRRGSLWYDETYFDLWKSSCSMWQETKFAIVFSMLRNPCVHVFIKIEGGHHNIDLTDFDLWRSNYWMWQETKFKIVFGVLVYLCVHVFSKIGGGHHDMTRPILTSGGQTIGCDKKQSSKSYSTFWKPPVCTFLAKSKGVTMIWVWPILTSGGQTIWCDKKQSSPSFLAC